MSPACAALAALLRRHDGHWLSHAILYEAGKHNMTARLAELRGKHGFKIEQRGAGEKSEYRLVFDPFKQTYATVSCPACLWTDSEVKALGGVYCLRCGTEVTRGELTQTVLF